MLPPSHRVRTRWYHISRHVRARPSGAVICFVGLGSWLCKNAKRLKRDRISYLSKTALVVQLAIQFNLEVELKLGHRGWSVSCQDRTHVVQQTDFYSITSSARASSNGGTVRPSVLAVLRLITSAYLVIACTGRSAGFSPLRMRST